MLVKGKEGIWAMGAFIRSIWFPDPTAETGSIRISWTGPQQLSAGHLEQVQGSQSFGAGYSQQLMFGGVCQPSGNRLRQIQTRTEVKI